MRRALLDSPLVRETERRRDRLEAVCALCLLIVVALLLAVRVVGADPIDEPESPNAQAVADVDRAILHLMTLDPHARIVKDVAYRGEVAIALVGAGEAHGVPALLLTTLAFRESTFDHEAMGERGELGLTQIMPRWRNVLGCDLDTLGGQVDGAARMLASYHRTCKSWPGALTLYATGKGCKTGPVTTRKIEGRIAQWQRLEKLRPATGEVP
jgi:soluble lytic murein transglycosylase-like protein